MLEKQEFPLLKYYLDFRMTAANILPLVARRAATCARLCPATSRATCDGTTAASTLLSTSREASTTCTPTTCAAGIAAVSWVADMCPRHVVATARAAGFCPCCRVFWRTKTA